MKHEDQGIAARPVCVTCGSTIWTTSNTKRRKYCSIECTRKAGAKNMNALRYAPPKPLASNGFTVGQTVRVPTSEVRKIDGKPVTVTGSAIGKVRKIDGGRVLVSVTGKRGCRVDEQTLRDAQKVRDLPVQFGYGIAVGGDAS